MPWTHEGSNCRGIGIAPGPTMPFGLGQTQRLFFRRINRPSVPAEIISVGVQLAPHMMSAAGVCRDPQPPAFIAYYTRSLSGL
jgi:hypothetical protein